MFRLDDHKVYDIPAEGGNFDDPEVQGPPLDTLKPIEITQPEGPSFTVEGDLVSWANWRFPIGFDAREGSCCAASASRRRPGRRARHHLPGVDRRDGGPVRRPVAGAVLAELLRHRRVPVRPVRQLAGAGLRLPRRDPLLRRHARRRARQPARHPERHLHARGGLRHPLEAHRHLHGLERGPPPAPPGDQLLHHRRQLRLRLLLVPLPRRHDRVRGQGHRRRVHLGVPPRRATTPTPPRSRPASAPVPPAPVQRPARHDGRRPRQRRRGGRRGAPADGRGQPVRQRVHEAAHALRTESEAARDADPSVGRAWHIVNTEKQNRLGQPVAYELLPQGLPVLLADPNRRSPSAPASRASTCGSPATTRRSATPPATSSTRTPAATACPATPRPTARSTARTSSSGTPSARPHFPRLEDWPVMPVDYAKFTLKPYGFFDRNPTLDVPSSESMGMACHADVMGHGVHQGAGACDCAAGSCTCSGHAH